MSTQQTITAVANHLSDLTSGQDLEVYDQQTQDLYLQDARDILDTIRAANQVTTAEHLDTLPTWTILVCHGGFAWQKYPTGLWLTNGTPGGFTSHELVAGRLLPATIIDTPTEK